MRRDAHQELTQELQARVAIRVLGGGGRVEDAEFEAHLEACKVCREEAARLRPVVGELVLSAPSAEPPAGLRERVLARLRGRPAAVLPAGEREWVASDVLGVEISQLWLDNERRRHTTLVRMASGTSLPRHRHAGPEECFVVQGDVRVERDRVLVAGDYVRYDPGTEHALTTRHGCLLLITASLEDRRIG